MSKVQDIEEHLKQIMNILEIPSDENSEGTPKRIAKMWVNELFKNTDRYTLGELTEVMALFPCKPKNKGTVIVKDIPFSSTCAHHWLPFSGTATVGYLPGDKVIGLSKIPRTVKYFSKMPQLQETYTADIGNFLYGILKPEGIVVQVNAKHQCVMCRGAESDCSTITNWEKGKPEVIERLYKEIGRC